MNVLRTRHSLSTAIWGRAISAAGLATLLFFVGCNGCNSTTTPNTPQNAAAAPNGPDPALANLADNGQATGQNGAVLGQSDAYQPQQSGETPQQGAPVADEYNATDNSYEQANAEGEPVVTADQAPPPLPEYDQPAAPDSNYMWTPGYWGWGDNGYYWVPGEWVPPPYYGALWTPPYWGWCSVHYCFHRGYWGAHVGFYGGIDYGFGYVGFGYFGGYWRGHDFYYNRSVTNVGSGVRNFYERPVVVNNVNYSARPSNRVSYNGGHGGINVQPRPAEVAAMHESHERPVAAQMATRQQAMRDPQSGFNQNHGRPQTPAFARPSGTPQHIAEAPANHGAPYNRPIEPGNHPGAPNPGNRPGAPNPGNRPGMPNNAQQQRNMPQQQQQQRGNEQPRPTPQQPRQPENHPAPQPTHQPPQQHNENHMTPPQRSNPAPRPTPQPQPQRAAPAPRPMPQQQRTAPAPRPTPQPQRAAPAPRPAAPAPHPAAPAPHPAAPAPHPAPAPNEHPH